MRNVGLWLLFSAHALSHLFSSVGSLPVSALDAQLLDRGRPSAFRRAWAAPQLKKSPSPFSALKMEMSVDEALDRVATFQQYFLVGSKWTAESLAIMAGVFSTQQKFDSRRESILGSFATVRPSAVVGMCNSFFFAGQAVGVLLAGQIGDTLGRRAAIMASSATVSLFAILTAFATSPTMFAILRLLTGLGVGLGGSNCYVLATEFVGSEFHAAAGIGMSAFATMGMLLVAPIAFWLRDWRKLMLIVGLLNSYPLLLQSWILESPRWLLAKGRKAEAEDTIRRAVACVRGASTDGRDIGLRAPRHSQGGKSRTAEGLTQGLQCPAFRWRLGVMAGCWFVTGLVFYGLACNVGRVPGSTHVNQCLFAVADLIAIPLQLWLVSRLNRRPSMALVAVTAACALLSAGRSEEPVLGKVRLLVAKTAVTAYFALCYLYSSELFPTSLRSSAVACCSLAARVATILAPLLLSAVETLALPTREVFPTSPAQLAPLGQSSATSRAVTGFRTVLSGDQLLYSIFAVGMLWSGAVALLLLPETKGLGLSQTLQDLRKSRG